MTEPRLSRYASLLLDTCLGVRAGWQVMVWGTPLARPLIEELTGQLAERDAYALLRLTFGGGLVYHRDWVRRAPLERLAVPAPVDAQTLGEIDALVVVFAPENTRDGSDIAPERLAAVQGAYAAAQARIHDSVIPWVTCFFPTPALAQDAGMTNAEFEDFVYASCLLDWPAEYARIERHARLFEGAEEVRIVGDGTDLRLALSGRPAEVDAGTGNMPGGEFTACPIETSAEGTISFNEFPAVRSGREIAGVRLRFAGGRVVDASAQSGEPYLIETLDSDAGARRIGELGVGCNPAITRYTRNIYFDEKIDGTIHIALGAGFEHLGGTNESAIHWDIVKDLRPGGRIEIDGEPVQVDGRWL
jgi:aminopeptidase